MDGSVGMLNSCEDGTNFLRVDENILVDNRSSGELIDRHIKRDNAPSGYRRPWTGLNSTEGGNDPGHHV